MANKVIRTLPGYRFVSPDELLGPKLKHTFWWDPQAKSWEPSKDCLHWIPNRVYIVKNS